MKKLKIFSMILIVATFTIFFVMLGGTATPEKTKTTTQSFTPLASVHVPILIYHYIREVDPKKDFLGADLSVSPEKFDEQLTWLEEKGYTTISLNDITEAWENGTPLAEKPIILTFDDGYDDFFTNAFPLLQKHNAKATTYVVSSFLDKSRYLSTSQLLELNTSPLITIGSHTQNHADLRILKTSKLKEELTQSKHQLEKLIGRPVQHFAYPYGRFTNEVVQETEKAGYSTATTTLFGHNHTPENRFMMRRVRIAGATSIQKFEKLLEADLQ